jgi:hypothetical protein
MRQAGHSARPQCFLPPISIFWPSSLEKTTFSSALPPLTRTVRFDSCGILMAACSVPVAVR